MTDWALVFLGVIAAATFVMAAIQVAAIVYGARAAQRLWESGLYVQLQHGEEKAQKARRTGGQMTDRDARVITTVSPRYAREIQPPEFGCGFDGILRARAADLVSILNGIDTEQWNPEHDSFIPTISRDHGTNASMRWNAEPRLNLSCELAARTGNTGGFWSAITRCGTKRDGSFAGIRREPTSTIANATKKGFKRKTWRCAKR